MWVTSRTISWLIPFFDELLHPWPPLWRQLMTKERQNKMTPRHLFYFFSLSCMMWDGSQKCSITSFSWSKVEQNDRVHHCTWMQGLLTRISALELVWKNGGGHGDASWPHGEMQWALRKADIWRWNSGYKCGQETVEEVVFYPSVPRSWYKISPGLWMK